MKIIKDKFVAAIILAAGSGNRMGMDVTKQKLLIRGESVLKRTVRTFALCDSIDSIVVVCRNDEKDWVRSELADYSDKLFSIVSGGKNRAESAKNGFYAIPEATEFVAIHDAARCLVTEEKITAVVDMALKNGAATAATVAVDSLKNVDSEGVISSSIPRTSVYAAQTPQVFSCDLYSRALETVETSELITDDNMLVEQIGGQISVVETGKENIKITTKEDLEYAEFLLARREKLDEIRIGHGYDVHRLVEERKLILGGVEIEHFKGLLGHSDADVLCHALMDSLLGAAALGDIGKHFPDTSDEYKGISSLILLERVANLLYQNGFSIVNIDITLIIQKPKIAPYIDLMIKNIAEKLNINPGRINIKATTEEHLGFTGREEGIACHAISMIKNKG